MNIEVAHKIKTLRTSKGLSQEQVADYLHVAQSTYARMESGETNSWVNYIQPICELYQIQPEELLKQNTINISHNKGKSTNGYIINQLSEQLIEQYELRLQEKDQYIKRLEQLLDN
ncbi:transcriptional regulator [Gaetbulibacter sp. 5U11]|nr:transcriptional regulator [Gaetbulibacter sp. 5U11]